ncbi:Crp/Fnr family transcriptional regulator [Tepiditoga spiralis]|nr:Crp/Fnr family transcriptional regulator [Tepiditoga spiralis]
MKNLEFIKELNKKEITLKKGEILHNQNELIENLSILKEGSLKVVKYLTTGKEVLINNIKSGQIFGETLLFINEKYPAYIIAEENSIVIEINKNELLVLMKNEEFLVEYLKNISKKILNMTQKLEIFSMKDAKQRVAKYLLDLYEKNGNTITMKVSKVNIAKELGLTRETVSRILSNFIKEKIVYIEKNFIKILNIKEIENIIYETKNRD